MYRIANYENVRESWREQLNRINEAKKFYRENYHIMTQLERQTAEQEIDRMLKNSRKDITSGVLGEYDTAVRKLKTQHEQVQSEKQKESAGWEAGRLAGEMQVYNMLIDQAINTTPGKGEADVQNRLENIYNEAFQSGDKYKQRAAAEVMKSANTKANGLGSNEKIAVNRLVQKSKKDLEAVRTTPELNNAYEKAEEAWNGYRAARQEVIRTSRAIGEGDPSEVLATGIFANELKRGQVNNGLQFYELNEVKNG